MLVPVHDEEWDGDIPLSLNRPNRPDNDSEDGEVVFQRGASEVSRRPKVCIAADIERYLAFRSIKPCVVTVESVGRAKWANFAHRGCHSK